VPAKDTANVRDVKTGIQTRAAVYSGRLGLGRRIGYSTGCGFSIA
jgi:hypothetical protein